MTGSILQRSLRLLLASWRGQLEVLAGAGVLLGFTLVGITDPSGRSLQLGIGALELALLLTWSIRAAVSGHETFSGVELLDDLRDSALALPRVVAGIVVAGSPLLVVVVLWRLAAMAHPLLGLALVLPAFAVWMLVVAPMLLAACGAALGSRSWLPRQAIESSRSAPLRLAGTMLVVGVVAGFAAIPVALVGMVLGAVTGGVFAMFFAGVASAGALPLIACAALATWTELGLELDGVASVAAPRAAPGTPVITTQDGLVEELAWIDGPAWDAAVEPGAAWGTWIRLPAPANVGLRIGWSGDATPAVSFGRADGRWQLPTAQPLASGDIVYARFEAGDTYVQLASHAPHAQAISVALVATGAAAAA